MYFILEIQQENCLCPNNFTYITFFDRQGESVLNFFTVTVGITALIRDGSGGHRFFQSWTRAGLARLFPDFPNANWS